MENKKEEFDKLYEYITKEGIHEIILSEGILEKIKLQFQLLNESDIWVCLYLVAIDNKDSKSFHDLNTNYLKKGINNEEENGIFNIIYQRELFNQKRLKKLYSMHLRDGIQFKFSSDLFISIIENNDMEFLKIILNNIFYDNNFILSMLYSCKFKNGYSDIQLKKLLFTQINKIGLSKLTGKQKLKALKFSFENSYDDLIKVLITNNIIIKNGKCYYPLYLTYTNNIEMTQLLMKYTDKNHIILELNEKSKEYGYYPLLSACSHNNIEMVQLLIEYANKNNIILEMNGTDAIYGFNSLSSACAHNNIEMFQLLMDYAIKNNIILELNKKNNKGYYPLSLAYSYNNIELIKLLMEYADKYNIILELNEKDDEYGFNPILLACNINKEIKQLIHFADRHNIFSEINKINTKEIYPLIWACDFYNIDMIRSLLYHNKKSNIISKINEKDDNNNKKNILSPNNDSIYIQMLRLLIEYANKNNIILKLNDKDENGVYPLLIACDKEDVEMIQLIIEYANKNKIILKMNEKDNNDNYPLLLACNKNNIEIIRLLKNYADKHKINLEWREKDKKKYAYILKCDKFKYLSPIKNFFHKIFS